ncbi:PD-(D/E)XK nuclease superfamily protein [bacterium BMS3Bbin04]|nr:PD-(D/E)XK nuclease superfamily protein [bacterium BMS3Bbin04]
MIKSKPPLSPFAPVKLQTLQTVNGNASSRQAVILDPLGEATEVGVVSPDYKLVKNSEVVQVAEDLLNRSGVPVENHQKTLVAEAVEMLENYLGKDYNHAANVILSEAKFMLKVGRNIFSGTVDQIRQNDDGEFTLLDFKSSKFPPNQTFLDVDYQLGLYALACWKGVFKLPDSTMKMLEIPPDKLKIVYYHLRDHLLYKRNGKEFKASDEKGDPRRFTSR